jgi:type IV secretion system protein VirB10
MLAPDPVRPEAPEAPLSPPVDGAGNAERVQARRFVNPATTVPKGSVIQAVLESALDSTRAGLARAIISRDVRGFDGSRVLIPRGSRLIGEYKADLSLGQNRALIQWQQLVRPDGATVRLDSPSADPLGRAGVKGKVNSHFLQRFGGSILRSALDIGTQVAVDSLSSGATILAVPGGLLQGGTQTAIPGQEKVQPTLTVKQGTSVSVFVARDLDFTGVE